MGEVKKMEANCAWRCPGDKKRGNEHKLKDRKVHLDIRKHFFSVWVFEHRNRFPREVIESPSLEISKTQLHNVLSNVL